MFLAPDSGHVRFVAFREQGQNNWEMLPEGAYVAPAPGDGIGSSWSTLADDLDRPSTSHFEALESLTVPAGTYATARCEVRPNENPEILTSIRHFATGIGLLSDFFPGDGADILASFSIMGGSGYFPLAVGNTWSYTFDDVLSPVGDIPISQNLLFPSFPNPFNPHTKISFEMGSDAHASLKIFDPAGRLVKTLVDEQRSTGPHTVTWNGRDEAGRTAAAGVYLYRFETEKSVQTRTMTLVK